MKDKIRRLSSQGSYKNSREIVVGGIPYSVRDVVVTAPLIAGLNVYLVGGTGEGKTQLANDLAGLFGDSYCYTQGRPDFEPSEILKQLNLGKKRLEEATTDRELVELTANVRKNLFYVDELNRCPPIIKNYFFDFFDGKLIHQGKIYKLGNRNYAVGFASGNLGDGAYTGITDDDRALKDRMHVIVKLDDPQFCTTEEDDGIIFDGKKDPRATMPDSENDALEDILALHEDFNKRQLPLVLPALGIYLHKGLDYLQGTVRHSKRAVDLTWPNIPGIRPDNDEGKIMPLSKRAVISTIALSQALEMIAEARGQTVRDSTTMFLDTLRFTVPYSGILAPQFVRIEKGGDAYASFDAVMEHIKADIGTKKKDLEESIALAQFGDQEEARRLAENLCPTGQEDVQGRWLPVRRYIEKYIERPATEDPNRLKDIKKGLGK